MCVCVTTYNLHKQNREIYMNLNFECHSLDQSSCFLQGRREVWGTHQTAKTIAQPLTTKSLPFVPGIFIQRPKYIHDALALETY